MCHSVLSAAPRRPAVDAGRHDIAATITADPDLVGLTPLELSDEVSDEVSDALAEAGLVVILDNHSAEAVWCHDSHGLWYTDAWPASVWLDSWELIATRSRSHPAVVGYDLRDELRGGATWDGDPSSDWMAAAGRAADRVLGVDDSKLIVIVGVNYGSDLSGAGGDPMVLSVPDRLVYRPQDYSWLRGGVGSYGRSGHGPGQLVGLPHPRGPALHWPRVGGRARYLQHLDRLHRWDSHGRGVALNLWVSLGRGRHRPGLLAAQRYDGSRRDPGLRRSRLVWCPGSDLV